MKNQKGFIGLISILIVVIIAALFMVYLFKGSWLSGGVDISGKNLNLKKSADDQMPKDINSQLDDLRQNVKDLQNKKDQEIMSELNK